MYKKMHNAQQGNGVLVAFLIILLLVAISGAGYLVWQRYNNKSSGGSTYGTTPVTTAVACGDLALTKGSSDGTAGTIYWHAVLTNNGAYTCNLTGYPAVFMEDAATVSFGALSNALYAPVTVTLAAHGGQAHAVVGLPDAGAFDPGTTTCTAQATSKLKMYVPGLTTALETTFGESACPGFSVTALQPGA